MAGDRPVDCDWYPERKLSCANVTQSSPLIVDVGAKGGSGSGADVGVAAGPELVGGVEEDPPPQPETATAKRALKTVDVNTPRSAFDRTSAGCFMTSPLVQTVFTSFLAYALAPPRTVSQPATKATLGLPRSLHVAK